MRKGFPACGEDDINLADQKGKNRGDGWGLIGFDDHGGGVNQNSLYSTIKVKKRLYTPPDLLAKYIWMHFEYNRGENLQTVQRERGRCGSKHCVFL
ncbi:MAG: hypothetical protein CW694_06420 [Candidatus Syntrophoarchaeum sp. WYZ-LMO15]|nr:MAG: hypothetical protein CW694_06420 [Candidatus Syntrophoarchaeum sp. WYZ-LMO15]